MSGLLLLRILDWRSILPTVAAVARPMVLYRLSADGMLPESEHRCMDKQKRSNLNKYNQRKNYKKKES